jgi:hypothetical protein
MQQVTFKRAAAQLWDMTATPVLIGLAYSGNGAGLNNPAMDGVHNVGVLPAGTYTADLDTVPADANKGPRVWKLTPDPSNDMKGRSGFMVHWDTRSQTFVASDGCIVPVAASTFPRLQDQFLLTVV